MSAVHEEATIERHPFGVTITCTCGKQATHRHEDAARTRFTIHLNVEGSRRSLEEGRRRQ